MKTAMRVGALMGSFLLSSVALSPAIAQADIYVSLGLTNESEPAIKLELDRDISLHTWHPALSLRLAGGALLLPGNEGDDNAALLLTPAFRYTFTTGSAARPFIEAGIGAALFLDTRHEGRQFSTAFQFEDRLAAGMHLGDGELSLAYTHYSNADIKTPNDGLDIVALGYRHPL